MADIVGQGCHHHGDRVIGDVCCSSGRFPERAYCRVDLQEQARRIRSGAFAGGPVLNHTALPYWSRMIRHQGQESEA